MKVVYFAFSMVVSLCAVLCCPEEDIFNGDVYIANTQDDVSIVDNVNYINLGDTIYISTKINNEHITINETTFFIDDYISEEYPINTSLALFKLNPYGNIENVSLNNDAISVIIGSTELIQDINNAYLSVKLIKEEQFYVNIFGITPLETGTYFIGSSYYQYNNGLIEIYSSNDVGTVQINTTLLNANENGLYQFEVN